MIVKDKTIEIKDHPLKVKTVVGLPIRKNEVVEMLAVCYAKSLLELEEYERRVTEVEKATSLEEINVVILDLPNSFLKNLTIFEKEEMDSLPHINEKDIDKESIKKVSKRYNHIRSSSRRDHHIRRSLRTGAQKSVAIMGERRLSGNLITSDELYLVAIMGSIRVDFAGVDLPEETTITVTAIMGEVRLYIPKNVRVIFDVTPIMGEVKVDKYINSDVRDDSPIIRVKGVAIMAEVRVITVR